MAKFVKLTNAFSERPTWVNVELVKQITRQPAVDNDYHGRAPERTELWFGGYGDEREYADVAETPEQILASADPENACLDPDRCSYVSHYLAYGGPDLTHGGYHAAEKLAEQHMTSCTLMARLGSCPSCETHEKRLRA